MKTQRPRRTAVFAAAMTSLQSELATLAQERRSMVRDLGTPPEKLAKLNTQMQALRDKIEGQRELHAEAAKQDTRDDFVRERAAMRTLQQELLQDLTVREKDAEEADKLLEQLGVVMHRISAQNRAAWPKFVELSRYITRGDARRARYDSLLYSNQNRISTGVAFSEALVATMKQAGVGLVGIPFEPVASYRVENGSSIQEAVREANERVARHLAVVFQQKADELLLDQDDEGEPGDLEPTPARSES